MKRIEVIINGVAYPCSPTMGAMLRFKQETGREITEMDPKSFTDLCTYLWCCVVSASKREGRAFDLSLIDFADGMSSERQEGKTDNEGENTGIHELLGVAIGCIGMSFDDFCRSEVP